MTTYTPGEAGDILHSAGYDVTFHGSYLMANHTDNTPYTIDAEPNGGYSCAKVQELLSLENDRRNAIHDKLRDAEVNSR